MAREGKECEGGEGGERGGKKEGEGGEGGVGRGRVEERERGEGVRGRW